MLSKEYIRKILKGPHQQTPWGAQTLAKQFLKVFLGIKRFYELAKQNVQECIVYQRINQTRAWQALLEGCLLNYCLFERVQVDFTKLLKVGKYKYFTSSNRLIDIRSRCFF